jgi:hypothetical protein
MTFGSLEDRGCLRIILEWTGRNILGIAEFFCEALRAGPGFFFIFPESVLKFFSENYLVVCGIIVTRYSQPPRKKSQNAMITRDTARTAATICIISLKNPDGAFRLAISSHFTCDKIIFQRFFKKKQGSFSPLHAFFARYDTYIVVSPEIRQNPPATNGRITTTATEWSSSRIPKTMLMAPRMPLPVSFEENAW